MPGTGLTAGNTRTAQLIRWLRKVPRGAKEVRLVVEGESGELDTLAQRWECPSKDVLREWAEEVAIETNELMREWAGERGRTTRGALVFADDKGTGQALSTRPLVERVARDSPDAEGLVSQSLRHNESLVSAMGALAGDSHTKLMGVVDRLGSELDAGHAREQRLREQLERVTEELLELRTQIAEAASEASEGDDAARAENFARALSVIERGMAFKALQAQQAVVKTNG